VGVVEDIIRDRIYGSVRCGITAQPVSTVSELARQFGLQDDPGDYAEIDETTACAILELILHQEFTHHAEVMPVERARELVRLFLAEIGDRPRYFGNRLWPIPKKGAPSDFSWNGVTDATFDTGVLILGALRSGCLWVEDED
jgi:hypothetical protein